MENTAIKAGPPTPVITPAASPQPRRKEEPLPIRALKVLASLRITVTLFALSIFLVLFGTLAQVDADIWEVVNKYFRSWGLVWVPLQIFVSREIKVDYGFPYPGGWLLGTLLMINLLAAHAIRFRIAWKRSGILLIHAGLIVLMVSELVAGLMAVESRMTIPLGESASFLDNSRVNELAIIDRSDPKEDQVVVIPEAMLRQGATIRNDLLPFDIEVREFLTNSSLIDARAKDGEEAFPASDGHVYNVAARSSETGVDANARDNVPVAKVTFKKKNSGEKIADRTLSLWFYPNTVSQQIRFPDQTVTVDGKIYTVELRPQRLYRAYTIQLLEFIHKRHPRTDTPKEFKSRVRLMDPERNEDREVAIYMNNPLRYAGETFFQSGFLPGDKGTILQVVDNPGWLMPYISCVMVTLGMLIHFCILLVNFLQKKLTPVGANGSAVASPIIKKQVAFWQFFPWIVLGLGASYLAWQIASAVTWRGEMRLGEFASLPILDDKGRVKPIDTAARTSLMIISGRQTFRDENKKSQPAIKWLLDVLISPPPHGIAEKYEVFRIENDQVLSLLDLNARPGLRYAISEITEKQAQLDNFYKEANRIKKIPPKERTLYENKVMELAQHFETYLEMASYKAPAVLPPLRPGQEWQPLVEAFKAAEAGGHDNPATMAFLKILVAYKKSQPDPFEGKDPLAEENARVRREKAVQEFNNAVADYRKLLEREMPEEMARSSTEVFFNSFAPFYVCSLLYGVVFLLACIGWLTDSGPLNRSAFWLAVMTVGVHALGLLLRMYLQERYFVFVTNLYSSAIFIGFGCVCLGLFLEWIYQNGIGTVVAAVTGGLSLIIAHNLGMSGDTLEPLIAVLNTNFWLATHVTCVTMGYTATFVAGFLGIIYVLATVLPVLLAAAIRQFRSPELVSKLAGTMVVLFVSVLGLGIGWLIAAAVGAGPLMVLAASVLGLVIVWAIPIALLFRPLSSEKTNSLAKMIYGITCFAILFSFTGTVLGGIWADQSWGRFWGWDPKENGALIIVLWNALVLHARWAGLIKQRGLAVLSVGGNIVTAWSWFGVNMLGVGLHSYGFMAGALFWLGAFMVSQLVLMGLGMLPMQYWRSFNQTMPRGAITV